MQRFVVIGLGRLILTRARASRRWITVGAWSRVPDQLSLSLRDAPDPLRPPVGEVRGGTRVKVMEYRNGMARIAGRLVDGWIDGEGIEVLVASGVISVD